MALKNKDTAAAAAAPTFETAAQTAVAAAPELPAADITEAGVSSDHQVAAASVAATTAIAKAATTAVAPTGSRFKGGPLEAFKNNISPEDVEALGVGAFPRLTLEQGSFMQDKKDDLGNEIEIELLSWNQRYVITAGVKGNDEEANEFVRSSYDGETLSGSGDSVADYIEMLKTTHGYENAGKKLYYDVWANLCKAGGKEIPPEDRRIVQIQLSPQSVAQFKRYDLEEGVKIARGFAQPTAFLTVKAKKKTIDANTFTLAEFYTTK